MDEVVRQEIRMSVRTGFYDEAELVEQYTLEIYRPGELDPAAVRQVVGSELEALWQEQQSWPRETDCDRLTQAMRSLAARGIVALENAGNTQSDGYHDAMEIVEESSTPRRFLGYCFYQSQDLARAVRGEGLHLAFGPIDPQKEQSEGVAVGRAVVEELKRKGFEVEWDGSFNHRIFIPKIDWKRRIEAPRCRPPRN